MDQGNHLADARYKITRALLAQASGSVAPIAPSELWVDIPAGTTITPSLVQAFLSLDTTGALITVNLPLAPLPGQEILLKNEGATVANAPVVNAGAGKTVEQVASASLAGTFAASTTMPNQGQAVWLKYDAATLQWKVMAANYGFDPTSDLLGPWTANVLPAASPFTPTASQKMVAVNTTTGPVQIKTPLGPFGEILPRDGQVFYVKTVAASATPATVAANGAGVTVEDPSNGGNFGATGSIQAVAGGSAGFKFRSSDKKWIAFSAF